LGIQTAAGVPLPMHIGNTSVTVDGVPAPMLAVANVNGVEQINFQIPHGTQIGLSGPIVAVNNTGTIQNFYFFRYFRQIGAFAPLRHLSGDPITAASPAHPGEEIVVYWTGVLNSTVPDGVPAPPGMSCVIATIYPPVAIIGQFPAEVKACSLAPGLVGVGQLN